MTPFPSSEPWSSQVGWCLFCGDLVRRWREHRGLDVEAVAAMLGVHEADVRGWEAALIAPSPDDLSRLVTALGVEVSVQDRLIAHRNGHHTHERPTPDPASVDRLRAVVDARSDSPVIVTDRTWTVLAANASAGEVLGYDTDELQTSHTNLLRFLLDPDGLRDRLVAPGAWHALALDCVRRELLLTEEGDLATLHAALRRMPTGADLEDSAAPRPRFTCPGAEEPLELDVDVDGHRRHYDVTIETLTALDADHYRMITLRPPVGP